MPATCAGADGLLAGAGGQTGLAVRVTQIKATGDSPKPRCSNPTQEHAAMSQEVLERARQAIRQHDPSATVELSNGALQVDSVLPAGTLVSILRANRIQTAESERSDCCGGCSGR